MIGKVQTLASTPPLFPGAKPVELDVPLVGVLLDQRFIGTRDWYKEGAQLLLQRQASGGRFAGGIADTAFALLFLKRATVPAQTSPLK